MPRDSDDKLLGLFGLMVPLQVRGVYFPSDQQTTTAKRPPRAHRPHPPPGQQQQLNVNRHPIIHFLADRMTIFLVPNDRRRTNKYISP